MKLYDVTAWWADSDDAYVNTNATLQAYTASDALDYHVAEYGAHRLVWARARVHMARAVADMLPYPTPEPPF